MDIVKILKSTIKTLVDIDATDDFIVVVPHVDYFKNLLNTLNKLAAEVQFLINYYYLMDQRVL